MAFSLKRVVDYKLLYDSLADPSNGMIRLTTLTTRWPKDAATSGLPRGLTEQWRSAADDSGYLDWERFSTALEKALEEDRHHLSRSGGFKMAREGSEMEAGSRKKHGSLAPRVPAEEIEMFLSRCGGEVLAQALSRTRKEVYKCQMSLHQLESTSSSTAAPSSSSGKKDQPSNPSNTRVQVPLVKAHSSVGQEKEELLKGMEMMELTRIWFNSRLEQLTLEGKQPAKKLKPEELLAALERKDDQPPSETLQHIQEINSHLSKLAKEAPGLSLEQIRRQHQQQKKPTGLINVASDPGPFNHHQESAKPAVSSQGGVAPVRSPAKVQMSFPAYDPSKRQITISSSRVSPVRSASMREFHTIKGDNEVGVASTSGPHPPHRTVSMSTQNLSDHRHQGQSVLHYQQPSSSNRPKRSHSFNEGRPSSVAYGSLSSGSHSSMGTGAATSGSVSNVGRTDYPRTTTSRGYGTLNQYPLRGSSSLQTLPSSGSYGKNESSGLSSQHSQHHHHGYHASQRSSSVRNIPSASGVTMTMATTATSGGGRPVISQPTSTTARVESVDIPSQPQAHRGVTAARDVPSGYPGHRSKSGHAHRGSRGENPKTSRRHLQKAVEEQSQRIKQLEAENVALTRDRGHKGQNQPSAAGNSTSHPVIRTSALQSVV